MRTSARAIREPTGETTLVLATREGDTRAFEELVRLYRQRVFRLCFRILGNRESADDVTQEVFLKAYLRIAQFEINRKFWPWLARVAHNVCIDWMRSRTPDLPIEDLEERCRPGVDRDFTFEEVLDRENRGATSKLVRRALSSLLPRERRILLLREAEGWTYEQIATVDASTVDGVRNVAWRARAKFSNALSLIDYESERGRGLQPNT